MGGLDAVQRIGWLARINADIELQGACVRVAVALAKFHNSQTGLTNPSMNTLSDSTTLKESGVRKALKQLAAAGYLEIMPIHSTSKSGKKYTAGNRYSLILPTPAPECTPPCTGGTPTPAPECTRTGFKQGSKQGTTYSSEFEVAWNDYPQRAGGNSKSDAYRSWCARLREGYKPEDMIAGTKRYRAFCEATGRTSTTFTKQASSFFGPSDPPNFMELWQTPAPTQKHPAGNRTQLPRSDGDLEPWARANGFGSSRPGETYEQYRVRLQREADQRERKAA